MKAKAVSTDEVLALKKRARYGCKADIPLLETVLRCLNEFYQDKWIELPDGVHARKHWSWLGQYCSEIPWNEKIDGHGSSSNALANRFMFSVLTRNYREIRRIAEAVKLSYEGFERTDEDAFVSLEPKNPALLKFIRAHADSKVRMSARDIQRELTYSDGVRFRSLKRGVSRLNSD